MQRATANNPISDASVFRRTRLPRATARSEPSPVWATMRRLLRTRERSAPAALMNDCSFSRSIGAAQAPAAERSAYFHAIGKQVSFEGLHKRLGSEGFCNI